MLIILLCIYDGGTYVLGVLTRGHGALNNLLRAAVRAPYGVTIGERFLEEESNVLTYLLNYDIICIISFGCTRIIHDAGVDWVSLWPFVIFKYLKRYLMSIGP